MTKYIISLFLSIFLCISLNAQDLAVSSFQKLDTDMDARVNFPVKDQNGKTCALIKVVNPNDGFAFDTGTLQVVKTEKKTGETWVYVQPRVKKVTIAHDKLGVLRNYMFTIPIEEATTYEMKLVSGTVTTVVTENAPQSAFLIINTTPEGADVYIDEKWEGNTPFSKKYTLGQSLDYRIVKNMYHDDIGRIKLEGKQTKRDIVLQPAFGSLTVTSTPSGAQVFLDKETQSAGVTPLTLKEVASGEHTIRLQKDKYAPAQEKVVIIDGQTAKKDIILSARFATITVNTIEGAVVLVDGVRQGVSSVSFDQMEGICDIEVTKEGHRSAKKHIEVVAGQSQEFSLNPTPIYGSLSVESTPIGAEIFIDGKSYGETPNIIDKLLVGSHSIRLVKSGYEPAFKQVSVEENKEGNVMLSLKQMEVKTTPIAENKPTSQNNNKPVSNNPRNNSNGSDIVISNSYIKSIGKASPAVISPEVLEIKCANGNTVGENNALYVEYAKQKNWRDAYEFWKALYDRMPNFNKNMYVYGANILKYKINEAKADSETRNAAVEALMELYDNRIKYFGDDAKNPAAVILGTKAVDYLTIMGKNADEDRAFAWIEESVSILKKDADAKVITQYVNISYNKFRKNSSYKDIYVSNYNRGLKYLNLQLDRYQLRLDEDRAIELGKKSGDVAKAKKDIPLVQQYIEFTSKAKEGIISQFENSGVTNLTSSNNERLDTNIENTSGESYLSSVRNSMEMAKKQANAACEKQDWNLAMSYYDEAFSLAVQPDDKTEILKYKAAIQIQNGEKSAARETLRQSLSINPNQSEPHVMIANLYATSAKESGLASNIQGLVYVAAVNEMQQAIAHEEDPAKKANYQSAIAKYKAGYPEKSILFMKGLQSGSSVSIGGWMGISVTVP